MTNRLFKRIYGQFYLDLYARENKRGGAWMDDAINRRRIGKRVQTPVAFLTCNFSAPVAGKPAIFTHMEVKTLFHEFGHGLHQLLTQVDELGVSVTSREAFIVTMRDSRALHSPARSRPAARSGRHPRTRPHRRDLDRVHRHLAVDVGRRCRGAGRCL